MEFAEVLKPKELPLQGRTGSLNVWGSQAIPKTSMCFVFFHDMVHGFANEDGELASSTWFLMVHQLKKCTKIMVVHINYGKEFCALSIFEDL